MSFDIYYDPSKDWSSRWVITSKAWKSKSSNANSSHVPLGPSAECFFGHTVWSDLQKIFGDRNDIRHTIETAGLLYAAINTPDCTEGWETAAECALKHLHALAKTPVDIIEGCEHDHALLKLTRLIKRAHQNRVPRFLESFRSGFDAVAVCRAFICLDSRALRRLADVFASIDPKEQARRFRLVRDIVDEKRLTNPDFCAKDVREMPVPDGYQRARSRVASCVSIREMSEELAAERAKAEEFERLSVKVFVAAQGTDAGKSLLIEEVQQASRDLQSALDRLAALRSASMAQAQ